MKGYLYIRFLICLLIIIPLGSCKKTDSKIKQEDDLFVYMPITVSKDPIIGIYVMGGYPAFPSDEESIKVILLVWPDGKLIWSKHQIGGGPPYFKGVITKQRIENFIEVLKNKGVFQSKEHNVSYIIMDSPYIGIAINNYPDYVAMNSAHELYECDPNLVFTDRGVERLDGLSRGDVLSQQTMDYKEFRKIWSEIRQASRMLIPKEGEPAGDLNFMLQKVPIELFPEHEDMNSVLSGEESFFLR